MNIQAQISPPREGWGMEHIVAPPALSNAKVNDMDEAVALGEAVALSEAVALGEELRIANHEVIEALK